MRTDAAKPPVRLVDYRPPDYLIDRVELDINLHLTRTKVRARLSIRPNPAGEPGAPLVLDGDGLHAQSATVDDRSLKFDEIVVTPDKFVLPKPPQKPRLCKGLEENRSIFRNSEKELLRLCAGSSGPGCLFLSIDALQQQA